MAYSAYTQGHCPALIRPAGALASNPFAAMQKPDGGRQFPPRMNHRDEGGAQSDGDVLVAPAKTKPKRPPFFKVVLLNDDYTPMDFVVTILEMIFRKSHEEAIDVMMQVHQKGAGICGVYTRDVAETKVDQVIEYARINDYPLQCVVEQE